MASRLGVAWRLASLGLGPALGLGLGPWLWLRTWLALLVDAMGFPPLWVGLIERDPLTLARAPIV